MVLCFLSPSEDGLKVLFRLKERCYDTGIYTLFYKAFVTSFSSQYQLEQVLDGRTCDVCRACFISADAYAFYQTDAIPIALEAFVNTIDTTSFFALKRKLENKDEETDPSNERSQESRS